MKKAIIYLATLFIFVAGCSNEFKEKFSTSPINPQPAKELTVRYNPTATPLEQSADVTLLAYSFSDDVVPAVTEIPMTKKGMGWIGSFTPDSSARLVVAKFVSGETADDNDGQGYKIMLYTSDGTYVQGSQAALSNLFLYGGYVLRLKRDVMRAAEEFDNELKSYPESKEKYRDLGWNLLLRNDKENGNAKVLAELDALAATPDLTMKDKALLATWYTRLQAADKAKQIKDEILKQEPAGEFAQSERMMEFYNRSNPLNTTLQLFQNFQRDFPQHERIGSMGSYVIAAYIREKKYDEAVEFLKTSVAKPTSMQYNTVAWELVENGINLETAANFARTGTELARAELASPTEPRPKYYTEREWQQDAKMPLGFILDTYATALYKLGQVKESIPLFEEAIQMTEKTNSDVNERYTSALMDLGHHENAFHFVEGLLKEGKGSAALEAMFKKAYTGWKGSEEGLDQAFSAVNEEGVNKLKNDLEKEMMSKPAPQFSLEDLNGQTVSLQDLKGKTVILDFWATWCGPCVSSFPGMQTAVDKFKGDDTVQFLFVNTWERGDNVKQNVAKFIQDKKYSFRVVMDLKSEVVTAYGVDGIPTKFVVDKNGNIRFKSVGFGGDANKLVEELSLMIEMVK
ncbi:MAG: redoxin domain-containing protein [Candidatus Zhuqueibacterota bacterium]